MLDKDYIFVIVVSIILTASIYLLIKDLLNKDDDMYYELIESNRELIEALNDQKEQSDIFQYHQSIERRQREQEEYKTGEEGTCFI